MDEFYQQFKDNLANRPEPPFDPTAWTKLEKKMNRIGSPVFAFNGRLAAIPLLLLLLGSNAFLFLQWRQTSEQISEFQLQKDTIVQKQVIYQTDTIYQTRTIYQSLPNYSTSTELGINLRKPGYTNAIPSSVANFSNAFLSHDELSPTANYSNYLSSLRTVATKSKTPEIAANLENDRSPVSKDQTKESSTKQEFFPFLNIPIEQFQTLRPSPLAYEINARLQPTKVEIIPREPRPQKRSILELASKFKPSGIHFGPVVGKETLLEAKHRNPSGYSLGLSAQIDFESNFQLWINLSRTKLQLKESTADGFLGLNLLSAPLEDYILDQIEAFPVYWSYSLGMQYSFDVKKDEYTFRNWRPLIGIGVNLINLNSYNAEYEFMHAVEQLKVETIKEIAPGGLSGSFLSPRLGFQYDWSKHMTIQLSGDYRFAFDKNNNLGVNNLFEVKLGAFYQF